MRGTGEKSKNFKVNERTRILSMSATVSFCLFFRSNVSCSCGGMDPLQVGRLREVGRLN